MRIYSSQKELRGIDHSEGQLMHITLTQKGCVFQGVSKLMGTDRIRLDQNTVQSLSTIIERTKKKCPQRVS